MGNFDEFSAHLRCPGCDTVSEMYESYTYIRGEPRGAQLDVGDAFEIDRHALAAGQSDGNYTLAVPEASEPVRLLNPWRCRPCGRYNWARITIAADTIEAIDPVALGRQTMADAHLLHWESDFVAQDLRGVGAAELTPEEVIATLREFLP